MRIGAGIYWARRALGDRRETARRLWFRLPFVRRRLKRRALQAWGQETIAFVCFGNICRSPFAERLAAQRRDGSRRSISAGYFPDEGRRSPEPAVTVARRMGIDLSGHRSRVLSPAIVEEADAIFVFDEHNYRTVVREHRSAKGRVHFIGALAEEDSLFIPDPFGGTAEDYELVYRRIRTLVATGEAGVGGLAPPERRHAVDR
jgi:protein-tyrosine phosphatase